VWAVRGSNQLGSCHQRILLFPVFALVCLGILLNSCTLQPVHDVKSATTPVNWIDHQRSMSALERWHINAKIGYRTATDGGIAWLDWRKNGANFKILVHGPVGAGVVELSGDNNFVTLRRPEASDMTAQSIEALSNYLLGWQLPVDEISYWLRGIPAPQLQTGDTEFNQQGLLENFRQSGWQITLSRYRSSPVGLLPGKLVASKNDLSFTLLVKVQDFTAKTSHL
jgi:outer membrane lipoprotein LolB